MSFPFLLLKTCIFNIGIRYQGNELVPFLHFLPMLNHIHLYFIIIISMFMEIQRHNYNTFQQIPCPVHTKDKVLTVCSQA